MTINCKGVLLDLSTPIVMGILNLTPDSFHDGDESLNLTKTVKRIDFLISQSPEIIDVGGMSSRPGAKIISPDEEWSRIEPALNYLSKKHPNQIVSVDTLHSKVANFALSSGAHIINDISAGSFDPMMFRTVSKYAAPIVLMHMRSKPADMQDHTNYEKSINLHILEYFKERIQSATEAGIVDIILDPGFGFSKTMDQNYQVLKNLSVFQIFEKAILCGLSRKSMIYKHLGIDSEQALNGTTALNMVALQNGAKILRVHDVLQAKEAITLYEALENQ